MITKDIIEFLNSRAEYEYILDKSLSELTSFKIGGAAKITVYPKTKGALCALLRYLRGENTKYTVLGFGSNILADDEGYDGVIIITSKLDHFELDGDIMKVGAGRGITAAASSAQKASLSGLEFAYGIPGTVGGAVTMNAGAYGGEISDIIISAECYDTEKDEVVTLDRDALKLGYRESVIRASSLVVLEAAFRLTKGDSAEIMAKMTDLMGRRRDKQPLEYPSAGSVFKRYPGYFTAQLIDEAGLKGYRIGGAEISEKHAGFIVNRGGATSADVKALIFAVTEKIREKNGITIERELIYLK